MTAAADLQNILSVLKRKNDSLSLTDIVGLADVAVHSLRLFLDAADGAVLSELRDIARYIELMKTEIGALQANDIRDSRIPLAGAELDAIVSATESATNTIMECAEAVMAAEAADLPSYRALVEEKMLTVFEACSFQDITGQRIAKVVETLRMIESRIGHFATAMKARDEAGIQSDDEKTRADRRERLLLHGPALAGNGIAQHDVDRLMT
jgi:chemotaxis protein CheZ